MSYKNLVPIHFNEADPAGVLYFANYLIKAHQNIENFTRDSGIGWQEWFGRKDLGVPLRHINIDYLQPLWAGKDYEFTLAVEKLGDSSVVFQHEIYNEKKELCTKIQTVHVFIDPKTLQKRSIPDPIREKLNELLN